jgi:hypothetical protein
MLGNFTKLSYIQLVYFQGENKLFSIFQKAKFFGKW